MTVGVLETRGLVRPLFEPGNRILVAKPARGERVGDLVEVGAGRGRARIVRRIGRPDVARDVLEGLLVHRGARRRFDPLAEREARAEPDPGRRLDLRELPTFTIDPPGAKDFDDAISAAELPDGAVRVWVHIADVTAYVRPGSALDREAFRRATSVYVPGLVEPMLPEGLSNRACSLVPGEDRLALTVELELDGARVRRTAFHRSLIRSDARLDYPFVDRVFAGRERADGVWAASLAAARRAAAELSAARHALPIASSEPAFSFTRDGHVAGVTIETQTEAHRLIEHLMIAANEAVAAALRSKPALFRVHEPPDPLRVQHLAAQLAALGVAVPPLPEALPPRAADAAVRELAEAVRERPELSTLVLRSLKQAHYAPRDLGHFGLALKHYCHFTSPIRRYPDIVCHRALLSLIGGGEATVRASDLPAAAEWCSLRERDAAAIERDADRVAAAFLLERTLFEEGWDREFEGAVAGVIGAGVFVAFGPYEGFLRVRGQTVNELETALGPLRIGDPVRVRVERVDAPRGRVDLKSDRWG
ncbi:MAG TPA: RNB domain-containing ribonuclease [Solirubrobacter sp.]|nr:RNB domain-containing ribonuclease [Solirubrobacter sp.]